jgi:hypothetical protein
MLRVKPKSWEIFDETYLHEQNCIVMMQLIVDKKREELETWAAQQKYRLEKEIPPRSDAPRAR